MWKQPYNYCLSWSTVAGVLATAASHLSTIAYIMMMSAVFNFCAVLDFCFVMVKAVSKNNSVASSIRKGRVLVHFAVLLQRGHGVISLLYTRITMLVPCLRHRSFRTTWPSTGLGFRLRCQGSGFGVLG